ncbi:MAG: AMP-dependent synthetase/ligase [Mariniblastus sp.]|nr:AMP-dependent synthetase/ligase [Mariniblastus sp.]
MTNHSPSPFFSNTLIGIFFAQAASNPTGSCLTFFEAGQWRTLSWQEVEERVVIFAKRLLHLGIHPEDRVAQISENRYEWMILDLAIQAVGAVHIPINPQLTREQAQSQLAHCQPDLVVVSDETQRSKAQSVDINGKKVWAYDTTLSGDPTFADLDQAITPELKALSLRRHSEANVDQDSLLSILYTSGTTGKPKGVMLSQKNIVSNVQAKLSALPLGPDDIRLCWLPMSHIFSRVADQYTAYAAGCHSILSREPGRVFEELAHFRPSYLNGVPYFFEKCYRKLKAKDRLDEPGALLELLGGRMQLCNCGGAPLADPVFDYFQSAGVELVTGYGLTEASPVVATNRPAANRRGSVGQAIDGVTIRIASDGEILVQGPGVMVGYWRDKDQTDRDVQDGWLHTGDLGTIDPEGYLTIIGRKKEMLITTGGHNISPLALETKLVSDPWIDQCIVVGDRRDYLTALIVPAMWPIDPKRLEARVNRCLSGLSRYEQIGRFLLIREPFSVERGLLTPKGSLCRTPILNRYSSEIDQLYDQAEEPE